MPHDDPLHTRDKKRSWKTNALVIYAGGTETGGIEWLVDKRARVAKEGLLTRRCIYKLDMGCLLCQFKKHPSLQTRTQNTIRSTLSSQLSLPCSEVLFQSITTNPPQINMFFSTIATVAALALANIVSGTPVPGAAPVPYPVKDSARLARQTGDTHEADFRTFGVSGCYDENQGVYTLLKSNAYQCYQLVEPIGSLLLLDSSCTCMSPHFRLSVHSVLTNTNSHHLPRHCLHRVCRGSTHWNLPERQLAVVPAYLLSATSKVLLFSDF